MRLVRAFSTSLRRAGQQPLFEEFVRPLNKEQQKAARKEAAKYDPVYHGGLRKDVKFMLGAFLPTEERVQEREHTLAEVEKIVQTVYGNRFKVKDVSLAKYARDLHDAPLELMVVDKKAPHGWSPKDLEKDQPPEIYNPSHLADTLLAAGYKGYFDSATANRTIPAPMQGGILQPPPSPPGFREPWPRYIPVKCTEILVPPTLHATLPVPFSLTPPHPAGVHLHRFIRHYLRQHETMRELTSLLFIWTRSLRMDEFTPSCLALMVIHYFQVVRNLPTLHDARHPESKQIDKAVENSMKAWITYQYVDPKCLRGDQQFLTKPVELNMHYDASVFQPRKAYGQAGTLMYKFLCHYLPPELFWQNEVISVALEDAEKPLLRDRAFTKDASQGIHRDYQYRSFTREYAPGRQPSPWAKHALIVQDPFVPTFNHAKFLSRATMNYFVFNASIATRALRHAHALPDIFGPHILPPASIGRYLAKSEGKSGSSLLLGQTTAPEPPLRSISGSFTRGYHSTASRAQKIPHRPMMDPNPHTIPLDRRRAQTIQRVHEAIYSKFGHQYSVQLFGSTRYGVDNARSDLDLVVIDSDRRTGLPPDLNLRSLPKIYNIHAIAKVLRKAGFTKVAAIPATVPIVKFYDPRSELDCDLNVNDQVGVVNTQLLKAYCDMHPFVRPIIAVVKAWAKSLGLNNPAGQGGRAITFNSYALALMTVGFFQTKGWLPNLQAGYEPFSGDVKPPDEDVFWLRTKKDVRIRCDIRWNKDLSDPLPKDKLNLKEIVVQPEFINALTEWFEYWGERHDYANSILSIREGGVIPRVSHDEPLPVLSIPSAEVTQEVDEVDFGLKRRGPEANCSSKAEDSCVDVLPEGAAKVPEFSMQASSIDANALKLGTGTAALGEDVHASKAQVTALSAEVATLSADTDAIASAKLTLPEDETQAHDDADISAEQPTPENLEYEREHEIDMSIGLFQQPAAWRNQPLCVADPFIRRKNVTGIINKASIKRFQADCRRARAILLCDGAVEDLLGTKVTRGVEHPVKLNQIMRL